MKYGLLIGLALLVILVIAFLSAAIKVVREYQRLVVFRLGRVMGTKGPGLVFLIPMVDRAVSVDLREFYLEIPHQIGDHEGQRLDLDRLHRLQQGRSTRRRRSSRCGTSPAPPRTSRRPRCARVVGDMSLDDVLAKREQMNEVLRTKLDEVTERWGVKVTNVEIREIIPPPAVQEAMTRQMSAERTRRAVVTEAEGAKQAAVTVAEGNKAAAVLNAEGQKQAAILNAEGDRQAAILRAEGFSLALDKINEVANLVATNTMSLQYLDTLKQIGSSPSAKIVVPMELAGLAAGVVALAEQASGNGKPDPDRGLSRTGTIDLRRTAPGTPAPFVVYG